ncbi:MAG: TonB-dependent receptor [Cyclobacteriaceae bacterium]|nr:TonB-dependent receptor [Cyclobacteriaceae bacterium]
MRGIAFSLLLLSVLPKTIAQDRPISISITNATLLDFVNALEAQSDYRFFFNTEETDSIRITVTADRKTIIQILELAFKNSSLQYSIDAHHYVYIKSKNPILTDLPPDFFSKTSIAESEQQDYNRFNEAEAIKTEMPTIIGSRNANNRKEATLAGFIKNLKSGESLIGATIQVENSTLGVVTDGSGYYTLTIPKGPHVLKVRSLGMKPLNIKIIIHADGRLNMDMEEDVLPLKEVVVESSRDELVQSLQMGLARFDIKTMRQLPVALGEVDVLKTVLTLPGVQSVGEGTVGFNVRGGATDQNLILYNETPIFNPSHLFGFFSAFNADAVKNVELYKSGVPAEFGGRISSVLDVTTREGNKRKWSGTGGISPITGRLSIEGPFVKDKFSILIGGRSTYSDWLLNQIPNATLKRSKASFYDLNVNLHYDIDPKNSVAISGYSSTDAFKLQSDTTYRYSNQALSIKWKHIFTNKFFGSISTNYSSYTYQIASEANPVNAFHLSYKLGQLTSKTDFNYFLNTQQSFTVGAGITNYRLSPGTYIPVGEASLVTPDVLQKEQGIETFAYAGTQLELTPKLSAYAGLRYSQFVNRGPRQVNIYAPGVRDVSNIIDTISFAKGKKIATSGGPELRASLRYSYNTASSIKASYNRHRQYIQMLSNTTAIAPTDIWKLSDHYIQPLIGDQVSMGYYHQSRKRALEVSVEAYYKWMKNFLDYKGGAELIQNHHIETDVLNAFGKAYGIELMLKRTAGKVNGWVSYTYSRSLIQTQGATEVETINNGRYYPSNYDKPHALNFIGNYRFNRRLNMSLNVVYATGRPITLPIAKYSTDGTERLIYSDRNQYRIPDYFRTDFSLNVEGNHKTKKILHGFWSLSVYNLTGRRNAYSVYFTSEGGIIKGYKLSIFGNPIPTLTYNFRF